MQANPFDQFDEAPTDSFAGPTVIGTPRPPKPEKPDLPSGWQMGPNGAQPIPGLPAGAVSGLVDKPDKPSLPAGYQWGPDGKTAVRIAGLPADSNAAPVQSDTDLASVRAEALDKIRLARSLQQRSRDGWFTTGFGSGVAGAVRGTGAYNVAQDTETLKNAGALTRIMEMAKTNGGKNPLTPLSNSDFQALASSLSNLDTGQGDEQYQANVQRVIDLYTRAYEGAGGTQLETDLSTPVAGEGASGGAPEGNPYLASATRRSDGMWDLTWKDGRKQVADSIPLAVGGGDDDNPPPTGGGEDLARRFHMGVGDVAQGLVGDTLGLVANPLNAAINYVAGTDLGTDLGASFRDLTGAPDPQTSDESIVSAINRGGAGALAFGAPATALRGATGITGTIARSTLERPLSDVMAGGGAGAGSEIARQNDAGPVGQVAGGVLGAFAGGGSAAGINALTGQRVPRTVNALQQAADRQKVTLMPADVGGTGTRMAAGVTGRTLGEIPMRQGSQTSLRTARNARDRVAAEAGEVVDATGAGQAAQRGGRAWMKTSEARAGQLFDRISVPGDVDAIADSTRATLADTIKGFTSNPRLSAIWTGHPRLRQTLEALTPTDTREAGRVRLKMDAERIRGAQAELDAAKQEASMAIHGDRANAESGLISAQQRYAEAVESAEQDFATKREAYESIINQVPTGSRTAFDARRAMNQAEERARSLKFRDANSADVQGLLDPVKKAQQGFDAINGTIPQTQRVRDAEAALEAAKESHAEAYVQANQPPQGGKVSWDDMKRLRSIVGEIIGSPSLASDGNANAALRRFYGALTNDMEATATQAGPRALTEFRRANQYWRGRQGRVEDVLTSVLGKNGDKGESRAFEQINSWAQAKGGDFKRLAGVMRSMPREEADTVRASIIGRMGEAKPGQANADGLEFSPAEWRTQWNKLDARAKSVLFPDAQHRRDLEDLSLIFGNMKEAGKYANTSNTGLSVNAAGVGLSGMSGGAGLLAAASYAGGTFALGKLLSSPAIARRLATVAAAKEPNAIRSRVAQLTTVAGRNPALAGDIKELQAAILRVANDNAANMSRSAASGPTRRDDRDQADEKEYAR